MLHFLKLLMTLIVAASVFLNLISRHESIMTNQPVAESATTTPPYDIIEKKSIEQNELPIQERLPVTMPKLFKPMTEPLPPIASSKKSMPEALSIAIEDLETPKEPTTTKEFVTTQSPRETRPYINEDAIRSAVVRVRCGSVFGSGLVISRGEKHYVLTAAHVIIDRLESKLYSCDVIFPRKDENGNYREAHYRQGKILAPVETEKNYKENGVDIAILEVLPLDNRLEDMTVFPAGYPFVDYDFCSPNTLGDAIILFGFAANVGTAVTPGAFMSRFEGRVVQYADVVGVIKEPSQQFAGGFSYLPKLQLTTDSSLQHNLTVIISSNNFSGASGGLVLDVDKKCVIGVNIATLVKDSDVFGFVTNLNFDYVKEWMKKAIGN